MELIDRIRDWFRPAPETIEASWEEAPDLLQEQRGEDIENVRQQARDLMEETEDILSRLEDGVKELTSYSDPKGRQQIEDIAESFANARQRKIDTFDPADTIEQHHQDLQVFTEDFTDISKKQGAVFDEIKSGSETFATALQDLIDHVEQVGQFLDDEYPLLATEERIEDLVSSIRTKQNKIEERTEAIDEQAVTELEDERASIDNEIMELEASEAWEQKEELEAEIEDLKDEQAEIRSTLRRATNKLERGLKKLIYQIEHGDLELDADIRKLRSLRDGDVMTFESPYEDLVAARDTIKDEAILNDRKSETFADAVAVFQDYEDKARRIETLDAEIDAAQEQRSALSVTDELEDLEDQRDAIKDKIERQKEKNKDRRDAITRLEGEIDQIKDQLLDELNSVIYDEIVFETDERSSA